MNIEIKSVRRAAHELERNRGYHVVSLREASLRGKQHPVDRFLRKCRSSIVMYFDDVWLPEHESMGWVLPTREQIAAILDWAKGKDGFLVHCKAGISRSSAVAYAIGCQMASASEAFKLLDTSNHRPNELIVRLAADILEDPEVYRVWASVYGDDLFEGLLNEVAP